MLPRAWQTRSVWRRISRYTMRFIRSHQIKPENREGHASVWAVPVAIALLAAASLTRAQPSPPANQEAETGGEPAGQRIDAQDADTEGPEPRSGEPDEPDAVSFRADGERPPVRDLDTTLSGRSQSELFLQRPRIRNLGDGTYVLWTDPDIYPFYQTLSLRADQVLHRGLSVHFEGWAGLDLADVHFDQRLVGDPTYLYLQFRELGIDARAGRQMVFTGVSRGLHLDGIYASYQSPIYLGVEALGGVQVTPDRGPHWYREQPQVGFDDFNAGFSDWERPGEYAVGGRVFYRRTGVVSAGMSFLHTTELEEVERQLLGTDLYLTPVSWMEASGLASYDLVGAGVQEIDLGLTFYPLDPLSLGIDFRHADPTLFLSHMSIFSIFSSETYDAVGGTVRVEPLGWLEVYGGYHHRLYGYTERGAEASDHGYEIDAGVSSRYGAQKQGRLLLQYRRLSQSENAIHQMRAGAIVPFWLPGLRATANLYLDLFDRSVAGETLGLLGDLGLFYGTGSLQAGGSLTAGTTPYDRNEIRGVLRFAYNFDYHFNERRQP